MATYFKKFYINFGTENIKFKASLKVDFLIVVMPIFVFIMLFSCQKDKVG